MDTKLPPGHTDSGMTPALERWVNEVMNGKQIHEVLPYIASSGQPLPLWLEPFNNWIVPPGGTSVTEVLQIVFAETALLLWELGEDTPVTETKIGRDITINAEMEGTKQCRISVSFTLDLP